MVSSTTVRLNLTILCLPCLGRLCHASLVAELLDPAYHIDRGYVPVFTVISVHTISSKIILALALSMLPAGFGTIFHPPTKPNQIHFSFVFKFRSGDWTRKMQTVLNSERTGFHLLFAAPLERKPPVHISISVFLICQIGFFPSSRATSCTSFSNLGHNK